MGCGRWLGEAVEDVRERWDGIGGTHDAVTDDVDDFEGWESLVWSEWDFEE